jgi:3-deoxy-7-phosphoheptulonate synthase
VHREVASGLPCAIGFKNSTAGDVQVAVDAVGAASKPHHFLGFDPAAGQLGVVASAGNPSCHIVLRGGTDDTNFDAASVAAAADALAEAGHGSSGERRVMVDCSHANSRKKHTLQLEVVADLCTQIKGGGLAALCGVMIESHIYAGSQA